MNCDLRWFETTKRNGLLNPKHNVVPGPTFVVAEVVVQAQFFHGSRFKKLDGFIGPIDSHPSLWGSAFIVKKNSHAYGRWNR
ncbi:hypothetical protein ASD58_06425 [Duganella sp. Root1480D1]|nr:hypothetical protein ASD58_06425 [Duganella sp. Root1480D1]